MPRQPEVHFRLKSKDKNGKCSIYLQFIYNRNRLYYSFGQVIDFKDWNHKKQRVKKNNTTTTDGKFALNDLLDNLKSLCEKSYNESLRNGIPAPKQLKKVLSDFLNRNHNGHDLGKPTLFTLAERFISGEIKNKGKDKSKGSLQNYQAVTKHLKEFQKLTNYDVSFESITLDFFHKYILYLKEKLKLAPNTIAKDISIIKVFMGEAVDLGYTKNMDFRRSKFSYSEVETDAVYLTEKEINDLYNYDFSDNNKLEKVRDLFVFGCWVGLRFSDYSNIRPENIVELEGDKYIKMVTQKTKEQVIIPCHKIVLEIFQKYQRNANNLPKALSNQKFNDYIKEVSRMAGLTELGRLGSAPSKPLFECISSHTARRSFATNLYLDGYPIIELMQITGHRTDKAFLKYIRFTKLNAAKTLNAHMKKKWSERLMRVA